MTADRPPPFGRGGSGAFGPIGPGSAGSAPTAGTIRPSPVFLALVAGFAASGALLWRSGQDWAVFVFVLTGWVVSLCLHEFAHAVTAYVGGDRSVAAKGYLTLDPRRYAEPGLSLVLPILFVLLGGIGLPGGAVWINRAALRGKHIDSVVSLAGPAANVVFAVLCLAPIGLGWLDPFEHPEFAAGLAFLGFLQVTAAVLNLLPIPGLDGFGAIEPHLSRDLLVRLRPVRQWGFLALIGLLLLPGPNRAFFDAIFSIIDALGVDRIFVQLGDFLFRFWEN
jgi:Zn-dependent protease